MSVCCVKLFGRLGNQLFQIANGFSFAEKFNKELILDYSICDRLGYNIGSDGVCYSKNIFKNFNFVLKQPNYIHKTLEEYRNYNYIPCRNESILLTGYYQSIKYFESYLDDFISLLNLPTVDNLNDMTIAFHIRRGDYLGIHNAKDICGTEYFKKCFKIFRNNHINVFTDSPEYVKEEFKTENFNIIEGNTELQDLTLISNHDSVVCSNSSFSWWASLLGKKKKEIIVPEKWWSDIEYSQIYRKDFTVLKT